MNQILAIGTDMEKTTRFKSKSTRFLTKIFTPTELKYCLSKKDYAQHLAGKFCAKEAAIKALSVLTETVPFLNQIEIENSSKGIPQVKILDQVFANFTFLVSISHTNDMAIAVVMILE